MFSACSTDFDINAEQKDITVVYGLFNQSDSTHYVKITKAFLGESNAYELAQDPSLSSYGDDLDVKVSEVLNSNTVREFQLQKTWINNKDTGIFYAPDQEVYMFKPIPLLKFDHTYNIEITHKVTGKKVTATTPLIKDFTIMKPAYNPENPQIGFVNSAGDYGEYEAQWKSAKNGRIYEPLFRFHYKELENGSSDTLYKYVDWYLTTVKSEKVDGGEEMLIKFNSESFYKTLQNNIPVNNNVIRFIGNVEFILTVGGDDLSIYIELNKPSSSIVQERPSYTNISNGIGIFSCRYYKKISYKLTQRSVQKLLTGSYTSQLGFQ